MAFCNERQDLGVESTRWYLIAEDTVFALDVGQ